MCPLYRGCELIVAKRKGGKVRRQEGARTRMRVKGEKNRKRKKKKNIEKRWRRKNILSEIKGSERKKNGE